MNAFLQQDRIGGLPHAPLDHELIDAAERLLDILRDDRSLTLGQSVSLDDEGTVLAANEILGSGGVSKDPVGGGRHTGAAHHFLGKRFAALDLPGRRRRTEHETAGAGEAVCQPCRHRGLGPDDGEADVTLVDESRDGVDVGGADVGIDRDRGGRCITRGAVDGSRERTPERFPGQGVLARARTYDQDSD
jgi:hypothetical protein